MSITPYFDPLLGKLRVSDVGVVSAASVSIPDPLIVNNLQVASTASINVIFTNGINASTASIGNLVTNNVANSSNASFNTIHTNTLFASTATLGYTHISTIDWNLTSGTTLTVEGQMNWDSVNQAVVVGLAGGNVDVALGMETVFPKRVKNSTATTMPKGSVVYINGVSGNDPTVDFAIATSDMTSAYTLGLTAETITAGQKGWVTTYGEIAGLDLSAYTGGDTLYLSGATAGLFTNIAPKAPTHYVRLGTVVKATSDGVLTVNVINGFELDELHNVVIASLASGQILQSGVSSLWYNRSLASAVGELNLLASLGSLAVQNTVDYNTQIINRPSLGSLAPLNELSYFTLISKPSLGSLAPLNELSYYNLISKPSLGSLAGLDILVQQYLPSTASFTSIFVENGAITSLMSAAFISGIRGVFTSTVSTNFLFTRQIVNASNISTNTINSRGGVFTSTLSINQINSNVGIFASTVTIGGNITAFNLSGTNTGNQIGAIYGDGSDGAILLDGINEYPEIMSFDGSVYTLIRDVYATTLTNEFTLRTAGYRIFCTEELINNFGLIHNNGEDTSNSLAGTGALGGFYKAGGNGAAGSTVATAANGAAPATNTNVVGGHGGKGAPARVTDVTFLGGQITGANGAYPATALGGKEMIRNIGSWLIPYFPSGTAANIQLSPSTGGGSGAKGASVASTETGGGGGGGGVVFIAAPKITNYGNIEARGGTGGSGFYPSTASGVAYGGGGGGGGGIIGIVCNKAISDLTTTFGILDVSGGSGGATVSDGGNPTNYPVGNAGVTATGTTGLTVSLTPETVPSRYSFYLLSVVYTSASDLTGSEVISVTGFGFTWSRVNAINYGTTTVPLRRLELWQGIPNNVTALSDLTLKVNLDGSNTTVRLCLDAIENSNLYGDSTISPIQQSATARSNSTTNLTVTLGTAPTSGDMTYSVFARAGGTAPVVGTGNTVLQNRDTAPFLWTQVSTARQSNNHTWTTAAAAAGIACEINKIDTTNFVVEDGNQGWDGKVVIFNQ